MRETLWRDAPLHEEPLRPAPARVLALFWRLLLVGGTLAVAGVGAILLVFGRDLPDFQFLEAYEPKVTTRIHAGDGALIAELAIESRVLVSIERIPLRVQNAFLSAEDRHFYYHFGFNPLAFTRAMVDNVGHYWRGERLVGGSTITQQVAKNFLLGNQRRAERKIREAILAIKMERVLSKKRILELYLNEIYLGQSAYGVATASLAYFNKPLDALSVAEAALLAALPKAPANYHPIRHPQAALNRRNWVIGRMLANGYITPTEHDTARAEPLPNTTPRRVLTTSRADYFVEETTRELLSLFGARRVYEGGLTARSTLDSTLQRHAENALRKGLLDYSRRHGYRGPLAHIDTALFADSTQQIEQLNTIDTPAGALDNWQLALVIASEDKTATIVTRNGQLGTIVLDSMRWARRRLKDSDLQSQKLNKGRNRQEILIEIGQVDEKDSLQKRQNLGPPIRRARDVVELGDVILVAPAHDKNGENLADHYTLEQIPAIDGALVALDPHTGRILALVGGWHFKRSQFNRATQARRQPGSAFKPFVYLTALEQGFTPATRILDAPIVLDRSRSGQGIWKPGNYSNRFYGPAPMRVGIEKSRNLMTIRLAQAVGIEHIADTAKRYQLSETFSKELANVLGAKETTLLRITAAYASFTNGGKQVTPTFIDRVQDRYGKTLFRHDARQCPGCNADEWKLQSVPQLTDARAQITDESSAYQLVQMMSGVIKRGTGRSIGAVIDRPLAGKTGTTNQGIDAWFIGFSPDLVAGVFIGFDQQRSLGMFNSGIKESASTAAAPVFRDFMKEALASYPVVPFRQPSGIRLVRINADTGALARASDRNVIEEAFKPGTEPTNRQSRLIGEEEAVDLNLLGVDEAVEDIGGVY